ncbi:MAG: NAD-dependent epimerase/dehydratase family protein [Planctomycetota bacterium]
MTGATGFIGGHLTRALLATGREVRCLVRSAQAELPPGAVPVAGDLLDPGSLAGAVRGADEVYHLAAVLRAPWREDFRRVNEAGAGSLAAACAAAARPPVLVVVSSLAAGGPGGVDEAQPPRPVSRYGQVKLAGERAAAAHATRVPTSIVRPPGVLGPGDPNGVRLERMVERGQVVVPGSAPLSFIHVLDLCALLIAVAERGERLGGDAPGRGVYYAADPTPRTLAELARELAAARGLPPPRLWRIPAPAVTAAALAGEAWGRLRDRPTLLNRDKISELRAGAWTCSSAKALALGWSPRPLQDRLREDRS